MLCGMIRGMSLRAEKIQRQARTLLWNADRTELVAQILNHEGRDNPWVRVSRHTERNSAYQTQYRLRKDYEGDLETRVWPAPDGSDWASEIWARRSQDDS